MTTLSKQGLSRRQLLGRAMAAGALAVVGTGFIAAPDAACRMSWHRPSTMAQVFSGCRELS